MWTLKSQIAAFLKQRHDYEYNSNRNRTSSNYYGGFECLIRKKALTEKKWLGRLIGD